MRILLSFVLFLLLYACSTERVVAPREYLDERTAATITVVRDPWIFTRGSVRAGTGEYRDFLHLYAIDVNRMGEHKQYIAALHSLSLEGMTDWADPPRLELKADAWSMSFQASPAEAREIGIAQPVAESYALEATWWYFPIDKQRLATIANGPQLEAELVWRGERTTYAMWRSGREELSELTAVLP